MKFLKLISIFALAVFIVLGYTEQNTSTESAIGSKNQFHKLKHPIPSMIMNILMSQRLKRNIPITL
jgi:hypothetical protein